MVGFGRRCTSTPPSSPKAQTAGKPAPKRSASTVDRSTLSAVRDAIGAIGGGAAKSDVLAAAGLSDGQWNQAIQVLLGEGTVTKTGAKRGTRYHLKE